MCKYKPPLTKIETFYIVAALNGIKVVVRACYGACFAGPIFKYLAPNFVSGRPA